MQNQQDDPVDHRSSSPTSEEHPPERDSSAWSMVSGYGQALAKGTWHTLQRGGATLAGLRDTLGVTLNQTLLKWFRVNDADVQALLTQVRATLPTTQVLLIGKAQTGKSSIIRAMTGATPQIIGQGFRPHTTHTQRYTYPTEDLPLLQFIDTVGLGEGLRDPQSLVDELDGLLRSRAVAEPASSPAASPRASIIVVTAKITDFALQSLFELIQQLRQQHPQVPCLLAVTCAHDLYPRSIENHPPYPPDIAEVQRAFAAIQEQFQSTRTDLLGQLNPFKSEATQEKFWQRSVLIDFTLEEDGFDPVFYGLETFVEALSELLPTAEAQVMHQLLDQAVVGDQIGTIYRNAGRRYIAPFSIMAATLAAVPLPFATMPVLTALQVSMVSLLGKLYGQTVSPSQAGGIASAIAGGFLAQLLGRELVKFIPGFGSVVAASWAGAYTWALGEGACVYFGDVMGGRKPDPEKIQQAMQDSFKQAQERFKSSLQQRP
jgi:uncharacterized protein (DUF697 family)/predicted GTPase